jgi:hypothetical protein
VITGFYGRVNEIFVLLESNTVLIGSWLPKFYGQPIGPHTQGASSCMTSHKSKYLNPLNAELNPICYLLALLGAHHFLHISRIRVKYLFRIVAPKYFTFAMFVKNALAIIFH